MRSNREWLWWGEHDPLWAVSSKAGKQRGTDTPWTDEEFLADGAQYMQSVLHQWEHYGMGNRNCIEIGAGSGRLTAQLLSRFARVTAIDVSPAQVENAKRILGADAARVDFHLVNEPEIPIPPESADGMFTAEVFQHFSDPAMIDAYLAAAHRALAPDATICFHVPTAHVNVYRGLWYRRRRIQTAIERLVGRRKLMEYRLESASRVLSTLERIGYVDCELHAFHVANHTDRHAYYFARKAGVGAPGTR